MISGVLGVLLASSVSYLRPAQNSSLLELHVLGAAAPVREGISSLIKEAKADHSNRRERESAYAELLES